MRRFLVRRLVVLLVTLFFVSVLAFLVPYLEPGDPARTILGSQTSNPAFDPATLNAVRRDLGLDQPLPVQYVDWLSAAVRGDFGYSFTNHLPVLELVGKALRVSAVLALLSVGLACLIAIPIGTVAAMHPGKLVDNVTAAVAQASLAIPPFAAAPVAILVFAVWLHALPAAGWETPASAVLPVGILAMPSIAFFSRVTRASMLQAIGSPYVTASRARGASQAYTAIHHVLRNGMLPVMTLSSFWLAGLIGGSVVVEVIFAVPGMGQLTYGAVINDDVPLLQGCIVCIVSLVVAINTLTDIAYAYLNPAIRIGGGGV